MEPENQAKQDVDVRTFSPSFLRRRRKTARHALDDILSKTEAADFFQLIWQLNAIDRGEYLLAQRFGAPFTLPQMKKADEEFRYAPWALETLVNEYLTIPFAPGRRRVDVRSPAAALVLINRLRALENAEDGLWLNEGGNVLHFMGHLAHRQFPWQRGHAYFLQFFRPMYIFDFPEAWDRFQRSAGISLGRFAYTGFALMSFFMQNIAAANDIDLTSAGISNDERDRTLAKIAATALSARRSATALRSTGKLTAYKKSVLRQTPILGLPDRRLLFCPIPELIAARAAGGIFYDIVGDGVINDRVGERFEDYVELLILTCLPEIEIAREREYRVRKGNEYRTPDLLLKMKGNPSVVIECKAKRIVYETRFSDKPSDAKGLIELAQGVFQIWRYALHRRLGFIDAEMGDEQLNGIVLTLDTWADLSHPVKDQIMMLARSVATEKEPQMTEADMVDVRLAHIDDFESVLETATVSSLNWGIENWLRNPEYNGWALMTVHAEAPGRAISRSTEIFDALPLPSGLEWWKDFPTAASGGPPVDA